MARMDEDGRMRALVLDPDPTQQAMVRRLLEADGRFAVVGVFAPEDCPPAVAAALRSDVVLLDPSDETGLDLRLAGEVVGSVPLARVVLRSAYFSLETMAAVTALGVGGYLVKLNRPIPLLCEALAFTRRTGIFVCAGAITNCVRVQLAARTLLERPQDMEPSVTLTPREQQVLALVAAGETDKAIATTLQIQPSTVDSYVGRLCEKLHSRNRPHLVDAAWRRCLLGG
ncbi:MAG TPA: LuxR C-terminal-related transcriptional regulator [Dehalococcoidia bacterium]|nr:LuxR C-terminal-related transcriptional regulator [Dehalococcoidia bacterium]